MTVAVFLIVKNLDKSIRSKSKVITNFCTIFCLFLIQCEILSCFIMPEERFYLGLEL